MASLTERATDIAEAFAGVVLGIADAVVQLRHQDAVDIETTFQANQGGGFSLPRLVGLGKESNMTIALSTRVVPTSRPVFAIEPRVLEFGAIGPKKSKRTFATLTLLVANLGTEELTLSDARIACDTRHAFSVQPPAGPIAVAPGQPTGLNVTFVPVSQGDSRFGSLLQIFRDVPGSPARILLSGQRG